MPEGIPFAERLMSVGEGSPSLEEKMELLAAIRNHSEDLGTQTDRFMLEQCEMMHRGLEEAQVNQKKLKEILEQFSAPPWHLGVFLRAVSTASGERALVIHGSNRCLVGVTEEVDLDLLVPGDVVLLSNTLNVIMEVAPEGAGRCGELAIFDRRTDDGRLVLKQCDEEIVVEAAGGLQDCDLHAGDLLRWDKVCLMAFEKIERSRGTDMFLEETPSESFDNIGGLDREIRKMRRLVEIHLNHGGIAETYGLPRARGVTLVGCPGGGKTMLAKAFANYLARLSKCGRSRFIHVKPGGLNSMWYGRTEANYRELFRVARAASLQEPDVPVVMFFDEVDSTGAARTDGVQRVDSRVIQSFMAELDGLESRGNILVLAATNRLETMDEALVRPGRLGDLILQIPRPNMAAARDIFGKHLPQSIPYARNGHGDDQNGTREEIIDTAVSAIFSSNGESELATVTFRDRARHVVRSADLVSGAVIANIAREAKEQACIREIESGEKGIRVEDVLGASARSFESAARMLTPASIRRYLKDLPQDVDVVAVELIKRKVPRPERYMNLAGV